ncbi:MAG: hypothetical protein RLZZ360_874 [Candidatus Parcubacteria bacterium]|jgi:hypothetical protein
MKNLTMRALRGRTYAMVDAARGGSSGKVETKIGDTGHITADKDASLGLDMEAAGAAVFTNIKLS